MATRRTPSDSEPKRRRRAATTLESRENQMISLAVDLAEKQLREGTASAMVINHYLRLGTTRERLEQQKLERENELLRSRVDQIESSARSEELFGKALRAMKAYSGQDIDLEDDDDDY